MLGEHVIRELKAIVGADNVLTSRISREAYAYDATLIEALPDAVVFATAVDQVSRIMVLANKEKFPVVPRGCGINLSAGTIAKFGGIILVLTRMNKVLEIDYENRLAVVETGVLNMDVQKLVNPQGFMYAPDPASMKVNTLGGNLNECAGGMRGIKYGITKDHILGMEVVLPDGQVVWFGGKTAQIAPEMDIAALMIGSEGTLGVVTKIIIKLTPLPEAVKTVLCIFNSLEDAGQTVSDIIAQGIIPATLELMDQAVIEAVEDFVHIGLPKDAGAVLLIEVDGLKDGLDRQAEKIFEVAKANKAREVRLARDAKERDGLWVARRTSIGAVARLRPCYDLEDATVPRTQLPEMLRRCIALGKKYNLRIGMLAHAGDGNLHPLILFDDRDKDELHRVHECRREIFKEALALGGCLSGEHGIGLGKIEFMEWAYTPEDIAAMQRVKQAFDTGLILNPGKIVPKPAA